jgi:hypothetical protein
VLDINTLPNDVEALKRLVIEQDGAGQMKDIELREQRALIEHLRFQLAKLRRARVGQSSDQLEGAGQFPRSFEELKAAVLEAERQAQAAGEIPAAAAPRASRCAAGSCPSTSSALIRSSNRRTALARTAAVR